jgi:hypothetical protein
MQSDCLLFFTGLHLVDNALSSLHLLITIETFKNSDVAQNWVQLAVKLVVGKYDKNVWRIRERNVGGVYAEKFKICYR